MSDTARREETAVLAYKKQSKRALEMLASLHSRRAHTINREAFKALPSFRLCPDGVALAAKSRMIA